MIGILSVSVYCYILHRALHQTQRCEWPDVAIDFPVIGLIIAHKNYASTWFRWKFTFKDVYLWWLDIWHGINIITSADFKEHLALVGATWFLILDGSDGENTDCDLLHSWN